MWRQLSLPVLFSFFLLMVFAGIALADPGHGSVPLQEPQPQMAPAPPPQPPMEKPVETLPDAHMGEKEMKGSNTMESDMDDTKTGKLHAAEEATDNYSEKNHVKDAGHRYYLNRPDKDGFAIAAVLTLVFGSLLAVSLRLPHHLAPAKLRQRIPIPKKHAWEV